MTLVGSSDPQAPTVGRGSLESAARFAVSVLNAQVMSQGKDWDAKLAYTALKYLEDAMTAQEARNA